MPINIITKLKIKNILTPSPEKHYLIKSKHKLKINYKKNLMAMVHKY